MSFWNEYIYRKRVGERKRNPNQFQLTNDFDEETYVKAIHDAGFKKLIITDKASCTVSAYGPSRNDDT